MFLDSKDIAQVTQNLFYKIMSLTMTRNIWNISIYYISSNTAWMKFYLKNIIF